MASKLLVDSSSVNAYFTCPLCKGYFRQPYTIRECIHTFCKSCIFKYIVTQDKRACPVCQGTFGTFPLSGTKRKPPEIVQDHVMEGLVKKLFPSLDTQDAKEEKAFYIKHNIPIKAGVVLEPKAKETKFKRLKGNPIKIVLRPKLDKLPIPADGAHRRKPYTFGWEITERYRVFDVKICLSKMLGKRGVEIEPNDLQVYCNDQLLGTEHTLIFIQKTVWKKQEPLLFEYCSANTTTPIVASYSALDI
ncbi:hypothetical protein THRCLA_01380 [Thraustotheca clavata]|uniref:RING-type domain-containing protein n=1 Tax=Thraustotheca clavata TaxID=74557 RepID=A0A1W0A8F3_9STRA|nr:hypothetical protein THRCLA_01380 [Thraustotheca clavata]